MKLKISIFIALLSHSLCAPPPDIALINTNERPLLVRNSGMFVLGYFIKVALSDLITKILGDNIKPLDPSLQKEFSERLAEECAVKTRLYPNLCEDLGVIVQRYLNKPYSKEHEKEFLTNVEKRIKSEFDIILKKTPLHDQREKVIIEDMFHKTKSDIMEHVVAMLCRVNNVRNVFLKIAKTSIERTATSLASSAMKYQLSTEDTANQLKIDFHSFTAGTRVKALKSLWPYPYLFSDFSPEVYRDLNKQWIYQHFHTTQPCEQCISKDFIDHTLGYYQQMEEVTWQLESLVGGLTIVAPLAYLIGSAAGTITELGFTLGAELISILLTYSGVTIPHSTMVHYTELAMKKAFSTALDEILTNLLKDKIIQKLVSDGYLDYPTEKRLRDDISWWSKLMGLYKSGAFGDQKTFLLRIAKAMGLVKIPVT